MLFRSKGNVVTPDEAVEQCGADALRLYELFVAPFNQDVQWSNEGMQGAVRFLHRVFRLAQELEAYYDADWQGAITIATLGEDARKLRRLTHQTIRKATEDIERFAFNTYVSSLMIYVNQATDLAKVGGGPDFALAASEALETLILLLAPAAPHTADELWESIGKLGFTFLESWPAWDGDLARADSVTIAVQVNGKLRDTLELAASASPGELEQAALASSKVQVHLEGKTVRKVIVVPGKLVNVVVA